MNPQRQLIHGLILGDTKASGADLKRIKDIGTEQIRFAVGKSSFTAVFTMLSECYAEQMNN
jgi:hypothetical protein